MNLMGVTVRIQSSGTIEIPRATFSLDSFGRARWSCVGCAWRMSDQRPARAHRRAFVLELIENHSSSSNLPSTTVSEASKTRV
jgi:hypothetical protein